MPELPDITVYIEALEKRILRHSLERGVSSIVAVPMAALWLVISLWREDSRRAVPYMPLPNRNNFGIGSAGKRGPRPGSPAGVLVLPATRATLASLSKGSFALRAQCGQDARAPQSLITRLTLTTQNGYLTRHHRGPSAAFKNMEEKLSFIQRLIRHLPGNWASDMEAESRKWIACCRECGSEKSLWGHGGIRWKAAGSPSTRLVCDPCGHITWQQINYRDSK